MIYVFRETRKTGTDRMRVSDEITISLTMGEVGQLREALTVASRCIHDCPSGLLPEYTVSRKIVETLNGRLAEVERES